MNYDFNIFEDNLFSNIVIKTFFNLSPPTLPTLSLEQQDILTKLDFGNVVTNSVAGSGKTTTNLHIAQKNSESRILLLTYNAKLKIETRERAKKHNLTNLEVQNYHSFCVRYYDNNCYDDIALKNILRKKLQPQHKISYDIIIIDEAQDVNPIFYELICKIYTDNDRKAKLCILGDEYQSIYGFNGADQRYIKFADKIFNLNSLSWESCVLSNSFRITQNMALFINKCMLSNQNGFKDRIFANKNSVYKPRYIICDTFGKTLGISNRTVDEILYYFELGYKAEDFFILAPSISSVKSPVRVLANDLSNKHNVPMYIPLSDDEKIDEDVIKGKMVFSTFHQSKGLERKVIIIFNFDNSYFKFYKKDENPYECTNDLYVGATRGLEHLTLFHHYQNDFLTFIDKSIIENYCYFEGNLSINNKNNKKNIDISITNICKFLPQNVIDNCFNELNIISNDDYILSKINIPLKISNENTIESVSDITGIAIPSMFELKIKNKLSIFDLLNKKDLSEFISNKKIINKFNNIDIFNIKPEELLFISNCWNSYKNGYLFKIYQITNYNWLEEKELNIFIKRLNKLNISNNCVFEYKVNIEKEIYNLNGYIDCIDKENNVVYEFKCVQKLEKEHFIQLALYMYMYELYKKKNNNIHKTKYVLFNILNNEYKIIDCEFNKLRKIVKYLINSKYNNYKQISNKDFIINNLNIFKLYF